ncbi:MAG: H/ACA ribonucleoprotein complex subunit GAR1 [Halodesulfurarchaeum sp.]
MHRAGTVARIAQGLLVVRSPDESHPDIGMVVVDENLQDVGQVVDVFGPVDRPYLAVTPEDSIHPPTLLNEPLYVN